MSVMWILYGLTLALSAVAGFLASRGVRHLGADRTASLVVGAIGAATTWVLAVRFVFP